VTPFEVISLEGTFLFRWRGDIINSRQHAGYFLAIHGDTWQQRSSAGSIVADDATLIDAGRLPGLLKTLSKFTQWVRRPR
jgi:hypothetical protein